MGTGVDGDDDGGIASSATGEGCAFFFLSGTFSTRRQERLQSLLSHRPELHTLTANSSWMNNDHGFMPL